MVDSGSQQTVGDCEKEFPQHVIHPSEGPQAGLKYKVASGARVPNEGEVHVKHTEFDWTVYDFTFQHATVHCPIVSVRERVMKDCWVTFHKNGGHIEYPNGKTVRFVTRGGVLFVLLNVLPRTRRTCSGRTLILRDRCSAGMVNDEPQFSRLSSSASKTNFCHHSRC